MRTITVYLPDDGERKRRSKRNVFALLAATVIGVAGLAGRKEPPAPPPAQQAAVIPAAPQVTEKIVYVDRPVPQAAEPVAPKVVAEPAKPKAAPARPMPKPKKETPPPVVEPPPPAQPEPEPEPEQIVPPAPEPVRLSLLIEPRQIYFERRGKKRVTVTNPNAMPILITRIDMGTADVTATGYELSGADRCLKVLRTGESCRFNVVSKGAVGGVKVRVFHKPAVGR